MFDFSYRTVTCALAAGLSAALMTAAAVAPIPAQAHELTLTADETASAACLTPAITPVRL